MAQLRTIRFDHVAWAVFVPLFLLNYWPSIKWMVERWNEKESYTSHGFLIPLVTGFLLWSSRKELAAARGPGSAWGLAVLLVSLFVHLLAGVADVSSISGFTMVPMLMGMSLILYGYGFLKAAWFPIFFLAFMVPPPEFVISTLNFNLKLMASDTAEWLLNLTGVPAIRQGSFMLFGNEKLAVGDVCSGLRSLLALLSLSVLYAWLIRSRGKAHVAVVLLTAIPAAIVGNGLRIGLVSYLVLWLGQERVFKPIIGTWDLHLLTGSVIFIAALACLLSATAVVDQAQALFAKKKGAA